MDDFINFHGRIGNDTDRLTEWLTDPHPRRGDIQIQLISPQNTTSTLLPYRDFDFVNDEGFDNWPFMTVHNWGENPNGTWRVKISYKSTLGSVHVSKADLTLYGTWKTPESVGAIPARCHEACARGCWGEDSTDCDVCANLRLDTTLECVEECPPGFVEYHSYCLSEEASSSEPVATTATTTGAETQSEGESASDLSIPLLLSLTVAALILVFLIVIFFLVILIACRHTRKAKQTPFSRLRENIASV